VRRGIRLAALVFLVASPVAAEVHRVVVLQSRDRGSLTFDAFVGSFRADLERVSSEPVVFTQLVVNPTGFDDIPEQAVVDFLQSAFMHHPRPDLVMTIGGPAAAFTRKHRQQIFPEVPLLFASVDQRFLDEAPLTARETAVPVGSDMAGTVDDILQVFPHTSTVFMVMGTGPIGRFWHRELQRDFQRFNDRVTFIWSDDLTFAEILRRVAVLPSNAAVLYLTFGADGEGGAYSEDRVLADLHAAANAPLFGARGALLGHGIVGGRLTSADKLGRVTSEVAHRILKGASPGSIRTPIEKPGQPEFDARELRRWDVPESRLPAGSVVRFREAGLWERFRSIIIAGSSLVLAQAALIGALLVNRAKRRRAERSLREHVSTLSAARAALSNLSGRLLHAQEAERTRLGRELHDDIGQRMAFLAIDLDQLQQTLPASAPDAREHAERLRDFVVGLGKDIQGISHRLHSSKIEFLGLAAAAAGFCTEVSNRHLVAVTFTHEQVPDTLDEGIGISLFRVLQEALSNAVKHSGARHCRVTLRGTPDALHLEVADDGCGFDVGEAQRGQGLGLISMQDRLKLLNGDVVIESRAGSGTTVRASVPLQSPITRER